MNRIFEFSIFALFIASCQGGNETKWTHASTIPYEIDIGKYYDNLKPIMLSTIGKELVFIPLETRADLVIGDINEIAVYDSLIFVCDSKQLYLFNVDGKFIRKIGSIGRGPGEYLLPYFAVDEHDKLVYVGGGNKINCFDFEGNDMGSFETDFYILQFIVKDKNSIIFQNVNYSTPNVQWPDSTSGWYIIDGEGEVTSKIRSSYGNNLTSIPFLIMATSYRYDNEIHFKELFSDTLFSFMDKIIVPYAIFDYGNYLQDVSLLQFDDFFDINATKVLRVDLILEDEAYLYFKLFFSQNKSCLCIYNKKTGEMSILEGDGFRNDIDGGIQFWPKFICDNGTLVDYCDAYTFMDHVNKNKLDNEQSRFSREILNIYNSLEETSNPIIIFLKQ